MLWRNRRFESLLGDDTVLPTLVMGCTIVRFRRSFHQLLNSCVTPHWSYLLGLHARTTLFLVLNIIYLGDSGQTLNECDASMVCGQLEGRSIRTVDDYLSGVIPESIGAILEF